jgi:N-acetylglucosamine PTS system EIICBA or EIICB component
MLRRLGSRGFVRPSGNALQVVLGPIADQVAGEIRAAMGSSAQNVAIPTARESGPDIDIDPPRLIAALGGVRNVRTALANASRVCVDILDGAQVNEDELRSAGVRSIARLDANSVHLIVGRNAPAVLASLNLS